MYKEVISNEKNLILKSGSFSFQECLNDIWVYNLEIKLYETYSIVLDRKFDFIFYFEDN